MRCQGLALLNPNGVDIERNSGCQEWPWLGSALQFGDSLFDSHPDLLSVMVASIEHLIRVLCRNSLRVPAVLADQQRRGAPDG